ACGAALPGGRSAHPRTAATACPAPAPDPGPILQQFPQPGGDSLAGVIRRVEVALGLVQPDHGPRPGQAAGVVGWIRAVYRAWWVTSLNSPSHRASAPSSQEQRLSSGVRWRVVATR